MTHLYIVRCNFTAPGQEQAWNDWYSGPKITQMLAQPHFLSCQRFHRTAGTGRNYLALWTIASPEALETAQYTSQWGFADWTPHITGWSRDLFDGGAAAPLDFAVARDGALEVVSFDGMGADDMKATNDAIVQAGQGMTWLPVAGLDRHTPVIGFRVLAAQTSVDPGGESVQHAVYRPICEFQSAPG
jgi:hypothetical protein